MTRTLESHAATEVLGRTSNSDGVLFLATLAFGVAMLTLLAVLALADVVGAAPVLPFFALPFALFLVSALFLWRWAPGEGEEVAVHRSQKRARAGGTVESISPTTSKTTEETG